MIHEIPDLQIFTAFKKATLDIDPDGFLNDELFMTGVTNLVEPLRGSSSPFKTIIDQTEAVYKIVFMCIKNLYTMRGDTSCLYAYYNTRKKANNLDKLFVGQKEFFSQLKNLGITEEDTDCCSSSYVDEYKMLRKKNKEVAESFGYKRIYIAESFGKFALIGFK